MNNYKDFIDDILKTRGRFACGNEYHERHHIIPKCMGGTNDEENLIDLFAREHFEAHRLLALENPHNDKLIYAWHMMAFVQKGGQDRYKLTSEEYEEVKKIFHTLQKNKKISKETKIKLSKSAKLRIKNKNPFYGRHHTEETKMKISQANSGKQKSTLCDPQEALLLWNQGKLINEIAEELKANRNTISSYLYSLGLTQQDIRLQSRLRKEQKEYENKTKIVLQLWNDALMTQSDIHKQTKIGINTIRKILDEHGIDEHARRSRSTEINNKNRKRIS